LIVSMPVVMNDPVVRMASFILRWGPRVGSFEWEHHTGRNAERRQSSVKKRLAVPPQTLLRNHLDLALLDLRDPGVDFPIQRRNQSRDRCHRVHNKVEFDLQFMPQRKALCLTGFRIFLADFLNSWFHTRIIARCEKCGPFARVDCHPWGGTPAFFGSASGPGLESGTSVSVPERKSNRG